MGKISLTAINTNYNFIYELKLNNMSLEYVYESFKRVICSWVELFWFLIQLKELVHMSQLWIRLTYSSVLCLLIH